jgi:DNA polymerase elongation subunit (family B)
LLLNGRKKYKGIKYEIGKAPKLIAMGDLNKRRDTCSIVKDIYGGACEIIFNSLENPNAFRDSIRFIHQQLDLLCEERIPTEKLILSKSLNAHYKSPPAHKYLADRIGLRDPGCKPTSGDRIRYLFFVPPNQSQKNLKVFEMIETPEFIKEHQLKINYSYYLTNQIMNPILKLYALALDKLWETYLTPKKHQEKKIELERKLRQGASMDEEKREKQIQQYKEAQVKELLFQKYLRILENRKNGVKTITCFFK